MFPNNTKVLVVDDMMTMRKLVKKAMADLGFTDLSEASDGDDAWKKVQESIAAGAPFQLVISDWNMPNMKGIDLLRQIRQNATVASLPFLLLTAELEVSQVKEAIAAGVNEWVAKPFTKDSLQAKLLTVWGNLQKKAAA